MARGLLPDAWHAGGAACGAGAAHRRTGGLRPGQDVRRRSPCRVPSLPRRVGTESISPRRGRSFSLRQLRSETPLTDWLRTVDVEVSARTLGKECARDPPSEQRHVDIAVAREQVLSVRGGLRDVRDVSCPQLEASYPRAPTLQLIAVVLERRDRLQTPGRVCGHYSTTL